MEGDNETLSAAEAECQSAGGLSQVQNRCICPCLETNAAHATDEDETPTEHGQHQGRLNGIMHAMTHATMLQAGGENI